jgi:hypothetical protein
MADRISGNSLAVQWMLTYSVHRVSEYSRTEVCRFGDVPEPFFANLVLMMAL